MTGLYHPGESWLHRLWPGAKLAALAGVGTVLFLRESLPLSVGMLAVVLALYAVARIPAGLVWAQLRPLIWVLAILFAVQWLIDGLPMAIFMITRLVALILLAALVTLTTRSADMIDTLTRALSPLRLIGVDPARVSLALSLALRFIPVLGTITEDVREAQRARGLDRSVIALAVPLILRLLRMADEIAEAIDARGYDPGEAKVRIRDRQ